MRNERSHQYKFNIVRLQGFSNTFYSSVNLKTYILCLGKTAAMLLSIPQNVHMKTEETFQRQFFIGHFPHTSKDFPQASCTGFIIILTKDCHKHVLGIWKV